MIILTVLILSDQAPILPVETIIAALPSSINITINTIKYNPFTTSCSSIDKCSTNISSITTSIHNK